MAPHSSTLAWKIPWTEEPGGLQFMGLQRVGHDWATSLSLFTLMHWRRKWQPTPVLLPGESQGQKSLVSCHLWGRTESDTTEVTQQQQQQQQQQLDSFKHHYLFYYFSKFLFDMGYSWLRNNVGIVLGEWWRNAAIPIHVSILPQTSLPSRLPQIIEQSFMCYAVWPCGLSILKIAVCLCPSETP